MTFTKKEELVQQGYLSKSTYKNLVLYNYTDKCTYDRYWIPETLESRGSVYDVFTGKCVARAFDKFFNLGEHASTFASSLPSEPPVEIAEKVDGSLGILYRDPEDRTWRVCTRGSFHSDQAHKAMELLKKYNIEAWPDAYTPLVEIVYPENRIIVNYGAVEELVLLGARNIETGDYADRTWLDRMARVVGVRTAHVYAGTLESLVERAETLSPMHEGWVLRYANGLRVKIKGKRYLEIAKFKSNLGPIAVWEAMMNDRLTTFLIACPEELYDEAMVVVNKLKEQLSALVDEFKRLTAPLDLLHQNPGPDIGKQIQQLPKWCQPCAFNVVRKKTFDSIDLLKQIRPDGNKYACLDTFIKRHETCPA